MYPLPWFRMAPDACSLTEVRCHNEPLCGVSLFIEPPEDMRLRRSWPDICHRDKPTEALRRHCLVGFPPGDSEVPRNRPVPALVYLFAAHSRSATKSPRLTETLHKSATEDIVPHITRQILEVQTFARSTAAPRARPCSTSDFCADDKDYFVQGPVGSSFKAVSSSLGVRETFPSKV